MEQLDSLFLLPANGGEEWREVDSGELGGPATDRICENLLQNVDELSPGSSSLVCQALVEEEAGWLPSPPATSKIEIAQEKGWVGPLEVGQVQEQEEVEEGIQCELHRWSTPTCGRMALFRGNIQDTRSHLPVGFALIGGLWQSM